MYSLCYFIADTHAQEPTHYETQCKHEINRNNFICATSTVAAAVADFFSLRAKAFTFSFRQFWFQRFFAVSYDRIGDSIGGDGDGSSGGGGDKKILYIKKLFIFTVGYKQGE